MKRYYMVPIIEEVDEDTGGRRFRAKVPAGLSFVAEIPTDPLTGLPTSSWALVLVSGANHLPLLLDPQVDALPDFPKDAKVSAMHLATKTAMRDAIARRGLDLGFADNADGFREVIRGIGRALNANFHEDNFDVSD